MQKYIQIVVFIVFLAFASLLGYSLYLDIQEKYEERKLRRLQIEDHRLQVEILTLRVRQLQLEEYQDQ